MKHRRNAILWAIGWWIVRRQVRRRAAVAVAGVGATAAAQRGRIRAVLGAVLLVGLLAAGLVAARKLLASGEPAEAPSLGGRAAFPTCRPSRTRRALRPSRTRAQLPRDAGRRAGAGRRPLDPRRARPVRARQARRDRPARARSRACRQARVERGPVRPLPRGDRGGRARARRVEPLPRRRLLPTPRGALRSTRRRLRRGDRRGGSRRRDRLCVPGDTRHGRRDRHAVALVPQLRPRPAEGGGDHGAHPARATGGSTWTRSSAPSRTARSSRSSRP